MDPTGSDAVDRVVVGLDYKLLRLGQSVLIGVVIAATTVGFGVTTVVAIGAGALVASVLVLARRATAAVAYRLTDTALELESWSSSDRLPFTMIRGAGLGLRPRWDSGIATYSWKCARRFDHFVWVDAGWLQRFLLTPRDPAEFVRRIESRVSPLRGRIGGH